MAAALTRTARGMARLALPARVRTAADRSSQHIRSAAARTSRRTASTLVENLVASGIDIAALVTASTSAAAPAPNPGAARSIAAAIASISSAIGVAVALCLGVGQRALGGGDLLVEFRQCGAQCLGAVFDRAHAGFCPIEPGIGGSGHRQPFGGGAFLSESSASATLNRSASFCRAASFSFSAFSKRSIGPSSRLKMPWQYPARVKTVCQNHRADLLDAKTSLKLG